MTNSDLIQLLFLFLNTRYFVFGMVSLCPILVEGDGIEEDTSLSLECGQNIPLECGSSISLIKTKKDFKFSILVVSS